MPSLPPPPTDARTCRPPWRNIPASVKRTVALRAGCEPGYSCDATCAYCGAHGVIVWRMTSVGPSTWNIKFRGLQLDHIHPYSRGGSNIDPENFTLACPPCNARKGSRLLDEWEASA